MTQFIVQKMTYPWPKEYMSLNKEADSKMFHSSSQPDLEGKWATDSWIGKTNYVQYSLSLSPFLIIHAHTHTYILHTHIRKYHIFKSLIFAHAHIHSDLLTSWILTAAQSYLLTLNCTSVRVLYTFHSHAHTHRAYFIFSTKFSMTFSSVSSQIWFFHCTSRSFYGCWHLQIYITTANLLHPYLWGQIYKPQVGEKKESGGGSCCPSPSPFWLKNSPQIEDNKFYFIIITLN